MVPDAGQMKPCAEGAPPPAAAPAARGPLGGADPRGQVGGAALQAARLRLDVLAVAAHGREQRAARGQQPVNAGGLHLERPLRLLRPRGRDLGARLGVGDARADLRDRILRALRLVAVATHPGGQVTVAGGDPLQQVAGGDRVGQAPAGHQHQDRVGLAARVQLAQAAPQQLLAACQLGPGGRQAGRLQRQPPRQQRQPLPQRGVLGLQALGAGAQRRQAALQRADACRGGLHLAHEHVLARPLPAQAPLQAFEAAVDVRLLVLRGGDRPGAGAQRDRGAHGERERRGQAAAARARHRAVGSTATRWGYGSIGDPPGRISKCRCVAP